MTGAEVGPWQVQRVQSAAGTQGILVAGTEGGVLQVHKVF